jgi:hypothetical protein
MPSTDNRRTFLSGALVGAALAGAAVRLVLSPRLRVARLPGSSIAAPDAAGWVTDFLNAAYYQRPAADRRVQDLRLAQTILTTRWWLNGYRRLRAVDVAGFHRAFGAARLETTRTPRGTLDRDQLLEGSARLLGDWFPAALDDDRRRGWGIAFPTEIDRAAYRPEERLRHTTLGPLSPPLAPVAEQTWHTYPPVPMPAADRVLAGLLRPETWPDYGSELGRFTPVRDSGLLHQTFEIEIIGLPATPALMVLRAYVTCTRLVTRDDPAALAAHVDELNTGLANWGVHEPAAVPEGAEAVAAIDLTTHEGHFMGNARSRLVLFTQEGRTWLRDVGQWDPMPWPLEPVYQRAGVNAQQAFWGMETPEQSMLAQIALGTA